MHDPKTYFLGDTHSLDFLGILENHLPERTNFTVVHVGDAGEGFNYIKSEQAILRDLKSFLDERNAQVFICRGNHSDPAFFRRDHWANKEFNPRIEFVPDYTVKNINGLSYQFVGGAISIDRFNRLAGRSWWAAEEIVEDLDRAQKVDVLVTHSAPTFCEPVSFSQIVYDWARRDPALIEELTNERQKLDRIFAKCNPKLHVYGHFHYDHNEYIEHCLHKELDFNELWTPNWENFYEGSILQTS